MFSLDNLIKKQEKELEFLDKNSLEFFEVNFVLNCLKKKKVLIIRNFEKVELHRDLGYSWLSLWPDKKDDICYLYHFSKYWKQKNWVEKHPNFKFALYQLSYFDECIKNFQDQQLKNEKNDDWIFLNEKEKENS